MPEKEFKVSIGLEIHVQLATQSKLFCGDQTEFGAKPNTQVGLVSLAYPGTLPVLNFKAVELAARMAIAVGSEIPGRMSFDRKNYFYPDLPKGYQITQDREPIAKGGTIPTSYGGVELTKIHLEEDAGKSIHTEDETHSLIDYNRAGMPLIEIVTEPVIHSASEAAEALSVIRRLVRYLEVSDGNMEEGSLRCDVNISLSDSEVLGAKVEIKNLNSIRFVQKAIEYEIARQSRILSEGGEVISETRLYDSEKNITSGMRVKETLNDYRYFPDPDLPVVELGSDFMEDIKSRMGITPWEAEVMLAYKYGLPEYDASVISDEKSIFNYFLKCVEMGSEAKSVSNWLMGPVKSVLNDRGWDMKQFPLSPSSIHAIISLVKGGEISQNSAQKLLFPAWVDSPGKDTDQLLAELGLDQKNNNDELSLVVEELIREYPEEYNMLKEGKMKILGMFMGQVMKKTGGKADPAKAKELLLKNIG